MRIRLQIFLIMLIILFIKTGSAFGQQIIFHKLIPPDGKSFDFVTGITQDVEGFMWYSTKKGLYSFDGNKMTSYKNNPLNPNSISSNLLESIYADHDGKIWIGSLGKGLEQFDPETGNFTHYHHDPNDPGSIGNDTVTSILRDKQGVLWIGTHGGLSQFDPEKNKFSHFRYDADDPGSLSSDQVRAIYEDRQGILWIGTGSPYPNDGGGPENGGLNRWNPESGTFTRYLHVPGDINSLISNKVSALYEDNQGILWIGTAGNGLHKMDRKQGTFERLVYDPTHPEKFSGPAINERTGAYEHICFITQDAAGAYWYGTVDAGLFYYNPAMGKMVNYIIKENSTSEFTDNGAFKTFTSRDNILWIGGTQGNIYHIDPLRKEIRHTLISGSSVNSFYEEPDGTFWMGAAGELIKIDKDTGIEKRYTLNTNPSQSDENIIYAIAGDRQGNIWVGTTSGLILWDKNNERAVRYKRDRNDKYSLSNNNVIAIYEDNDSKLWIGTFRGLNLLDRQTGLFTQYFISPADTSSFGLNIFTSILEDKSGNFWVAGWNGQGMLQFNRENRKFKSYLKGSNFIRIYEDSDGVLWVGGTDGLYKFSHEIDNFIRYIDSGSPAGFSDVLSIIEDHQKFLWIGTSEGIVRLNPQRNETSMFGKNHGIGENTLNFGAFYKGRTNEIYFGAGTGYFSFSPDELNHNLKAPEIVFTGFRIADQTVTPGDGGPVNERLSVIPELRLRYDQNVFSIDYAAIDYANPDDNRLIYILENYENNWRQSSSEQRAYYFNISPGKYAFRVKAVNSYGVWAEKKIDIVILPPWWKTWWAYVIYGILFLLAVFLIDRIQRKRVIAKERILAREKELFQAREIEKAYKELKETQVQLIQSEKMASLGELTAGIAHEIQNPLNFVNNFAEVSIELIDDMKQESAVGGQRSSVGGQQSAVGSQQSAVGSQRSAVGGQRSAVSGQQSAMEIIDGIRQNLDKILHHGKRADAIVKGMLQHSRSSSGIKEPTDINLLADEYLRLAYHGLRAKNKDFNATMKTDYDLTIGNINIIPQDIGRVILNLITNAFYAADEKKKQLASDLSALSSLTGQNKYEPTVTVSTKRSLSSKGDGLGEVRISVKDNGNGIPKEIKNKIFQPFFTTKPTGQGTGLGLSLSYDIVKAHGGELKVETKEGEGSEFIIQLPVQE